MINLIYYNETGEIVQTFGVPEFAIDAYEPPEGLTKLIIDIPIGENTHYIVDGVLTELPIRPDVNYKFNYTDKVWEVDIALTEGIVRDRRNELLQAADILIFKAEDLGQDVTALRGYRQALRDITLQEGFPLAVNWPQAPV